MAYPDAPPPPLPERFRGRPPIDASKCPDGCSRLRGGLSDRGDRPARRASASISAAASSARIASSACPEGALRYGRDYRLAVRERADLVARVRARARARRGAAGAAAQALRPLAQAAPGERRRLQRLRARRERAEHGGLGPEPLRDPVRRVAAPRRRPADHRRGLREHAAGAAQDLRRRSGAQDRDRRRRLRDLGRSLHRPPGGRERGRGRAFRSTSTFPAVLPIRSRSSTACCASSGRLEESRPAAPLVSAP